ncbi:hypothetical protein IPdc08_00003 [archaeon]|nr:hypothetical protein IPdc08_00003 [archaeon]
MGIKLYPPLLGGVLFDGLVFPGLLEELAPLRLLLLKSVLFLPDLVLEKLGREEDVEELIARLFLHGHVFLLLQLEPLEGFVFPEGLDESLVGLDLFGLQGEVVVLHLPDSLLVALRVGTRIENQEAAFLQDSPGYIQQKLHVFLVLGVPLLDGESRGDIVHPG